MRIRINHRTEYSYSTPLRYALQRLRLIPYSGGVQTVHSWKVAIEGATEQVRFLDQFGNETMLLSAEGDAHTIGMEASGEVETQDNAGVTGQHRGFAPLWLFLRETALTAAGEGVRALAGKLGPGSEISRLHHLMDAVADAVAYEGGVTDAATPAEEALRLGQGVCQDHAHVMIAAARSMALPARYVSGYLMLEGETEQAASHAWAEVHVDGLGWVGFDAANRMSPDARYIRLATGRDYRDAMPVSGIRLGQAQERLAVSITVEQ